ncbi:FAD-dependent oxidoreductase, partial [Nocardia brasiliensis]|uniref:FAD-dependent oxidoreductase n=1 Tax=Nocardia brasiliensis TaxID=37326 RepID=UPI002456F0F8
MGSPEVTPASGDALPAQAEVLVVGAGPAGSASAAGAARAGRDVVLLDSAEFTRGKTSGDRQTPPPTAGQEQLRRGEMVGAHT